MAKTAKKHTKMEMWFDRYTFKLNLLVALGLLATYAAPVLNPNFFWPVALLGLAYPIMLLLNALFTLYWISRKKIKSLLSIIAILVGWPTLSHTIAFNPVALPDTVITEKIKVMTYNVRNFDLYNWTGNIESRNKMLGLIKMANPDIICFQEFYTQDDDKFNNLKALEELGFTHQHFEKTLTVKEKNHFGLAIVSKYPIAKGGKINLSSTSNKIVAYADVDLKGQKTRIFNAHLQSIHLGKQDLQYVKSLGDGKKDEEVSKDHVRSLKSIVKKLRDGYIKRGKQADILAAHIAESPYPVIVCGDFNDTPASYVYHTISKDLQDTFLAAAFGLGVTYAGPIPALRIDYVLGGDAFNVHDFDIFKAVYSDHYPVQTVLSFKAPQVVVLPQ